MKLTSISGATLAAAAATLVIGSAAVVAQSQTPAKNADGTVNCYIGDAKQPQAIPMSECEEKNGSLTPPAGATAQQQTPQTGQQQQTGQQGTTPPAGQQAQQPTAQPGQPGGGQAVSTVNCYIGNANTPQVIPMSECEEKGGKLEPPTKTAMVKCYGINSCAGRGGCRTAHNACAGQNGCSGRGFVEVSFGECQAKGGKLQPPA